MAIEDLLKGLLGGTANQGAGDQQSDGDPLAGLLGNLLGGEGTGDAQPAQQGEGADLANLLGGLLGGEAPTAHGSHPAQQQPGAGGLADLLGGLMGAEAAAAGGAQASQQGSGLTDILGGLLGGAQASGGHTASGGGLGSPLGASNGAANNPLLAPIARALSEKLGLSPATAQAVVSLAASTIIPALVHGVARKQGKTVRTRTLNVGGNNLDLEDLLKRVGAQKKLTRNYLESTGLTQQLTAQTGLDRKTATASLQQTFQMLGSYLNE